MSSHGTSATAARELFLQEEHWPARSGRVPSLDGIRAMSIILVLAGHMLLPERWLGISALGLKTFFFISGFLITRLLLAETKSSGQLNLANFYQRRVLRLYPVIVVYVALVALVMHARGQKVPLLEIASVFLYFVNYLVVHYDSLGGQQYALPVAMLWSLSVEEHFYLLAPVALLLVAGNARKMLAMALAMCAVSLALRLIYVALDPNLLNGLEVYWRSETRFDCIAFGVVLASLTEMPSGRRCIALLRTPSAFVLGALLLVASFAVRDPQFQLTWRFTVQSLALMPMMAGVIFGAPFPWLNRLLNLAPIMWIGMLSYSLYVWHGGVIFLFGDWLHRLPLAAQPLSELAVAVGLAMGSYYLVERPVQGFQARLRRRAFSRSTRDAAGVN